MNREELEEYDRQMTRYFRWMFRFIAVGICACVVLIVVIVAMLLGMFV